MIKNTVILFFLIFYSFNIKSEDSRIILATTTSVNDSGLLEYLNNEFNKEYNFDIHVISVGTGQALKIAETGNADVVLVHHKPSEIEFIENGFGVSRYDLMYNDFIIIGPKNDNKKCINIKKTLIRIKEKKHIFLSRADNSGTHKKEIEIWESLDLDINNFGEWYKKIGQGMGMTLMMTNELSAYTISDRSTWLTFKNKENLKIICEYQPPLFNQYGIIAVNPELNSKIRYNLAKKYINWMISNKGKDLINNYKINDEQIFYFNYK